ncbi:MAG: protein kinase [Thermoanaerobaculia bacterium]
MSIEPGSRLGPYEIVSRIGAGGMGEVWRARDTRLDRQVAIKVLPAALAANEQFRARFEREAKSISQLNHPHVCTLFDIGHEDGTSYLVMELLEGESLAERLARGPLPLPEVLKYGMQMAAALDRAHRASIVHRDFKPGNVVITKSGAKLLDFGLAKSSSSPVVAVSNEGATEHRPLTQEGTILGTFQYMAPEQLAGEEADARSDIFALGAVLYEMITGRRAFEGKTRTSLIAAILSGEPPRITESQPITPPALEHVVTKCLAKDPEDRWQSARDIAEELRWISEVGSQAGVPAIVTRTRHSRRNWAAAAAVLGLLLAIGASVLCASFYRRLREARRVTQSEIAVTLASLQDAQVSVSPDGRRILAVAASGNNNTRLWLRDLDSGQSRFLAGTEGGTLPFWSPDGSTVGFFAGAKLKTINVESGAAQTLCDAPFGRGGSWSSSGEIVFAPNIFQPLMKVGENGGTPVAVTKLTDSRMTHRNPLFLPDGKHFLYCSALGGATMGTLRVGSVDGHLDRQLLDYASTSAYVDGWLLTTRDRNLVAQRFDADALVLKGRPAAIAQDVEWYVARFKGVFSAKGDTLVYHHAPRPLRKIMILDSAAPRAATSGDPAYLAFPSVSPDGRHLIVNRFDPAHRNSDLWLYDLDGTSNTRLTFGGGNMESSAIFSPDNRSVAIFEYVADAGATSRSAFSIQPAGGGTRESLSFTTGSYIQVEDWSRDGRTLLITEQRDKSGNDIEVIHLDGDRKPLPLVQSDADEQGARFSPDGRWMAYMSNATGRAEVYVTNYPSASGKWQVSTNGGERPFWSADGKQLYYQENDHVVVAAVHDGPSFSADASHVVEALGDHIADYAVAQNGRIVALREIDPGSAPLTLVLNWRELLRGK